MKVIEFLKNRYILVLISALVLVFIIVTINVMNARGTKKPDVEIGYVTGGPLIPHEVEQRLKEVILPFIDDVTGDGKKKIRFIPLTGLRVDLEFTSEGTQIMLMNLGTFDKVAGFGAFDSLDNYTLDYKLDTKLFPEVRVKAEDTNEAHVYAIPVSEIALLSKSGFPVVDYYLAIRKPKADQKLSMDKNENAHIILKEILALQ